MRLSVTGSGGTGSGAAYGYGFGIVAPGVPSATVKIGIFARPARRATWIGSRPVVVLPSESRTIAAGRARAIITARAMAPRPAARARPVAGAAPAPAPVDIRATP